MATTPSSDSRGSWDTEIIPLYERGGNRYTAYQFYRRFGSTKLGKWGSPGTEYVRRQHHGLDLKVDKNGFAYCPICYKVFNGGESADGDGAKDVAHFKEWGPPVKKRRSRKRSAEVGPQVPAPVL